jgi:Amt family ammonium transporter
MAAGALAAFAAPAIAQDAAAAPEFASAAETAFIFNTLLFLIGGFLVMFMAAGFAMLEAGLVRSKNVSMQCLKNIALYSIAGIMFWVIGYSLMYTNVNGGYFGTPLPYSWPDAGTANEGDYSVASDWFFQMVFCGTTASIVSGTLAERIKLWPFLIFTAILTGVLYPITGSWQWGGGWLSEAGFSDFAGSTHRSLGRRLGCSGRCHHPGCSQGQVRSDGKVNPIPGSNMALATLGTFILWLGWFGFNGASQLAMGSNGDVSDISRIFANTNLAACGGVVAAMILTQIMYKKVDVTMALNGALAGLVSITAEPLMPSPLTAIMHRCCWWCDRGVCRADARQVQDRRRGRCHPGSPACRYLGHLGRSALQPRHVLRYPDPRYRVDRRVHLRGVGRDLVHPQVDRRHPCHGRAGDDGHGHGGSRCRSLSGIHQGLIALAMKSRRDGVPSHLWGPVFPGPFFVRDALQASERWCSALAHKTAVPKNAPSYSAWVHNNSTVCRSDGLIAHSGGLKAAGLPSGTALDWHLPPGRSSWCWVVCQERRHGRGQQGWETR